MLRKDAKVELIRHVPLFAHCTKAELAAIASVADEIDVPAGQQLLVEGSPARDFCVLVDGEGEVTQGGERVNTLAGGDFFGEIGLIAHAPRTATVTTTGPSRLLVLTDRAFDRLTREMPSIEASLRRAAAERLDPEGA